MKDIGVVNGRFQVLNLKHMEYILAAKMRCQKLFIGLTNPDTLHTRDSVNDENRSAKSANPLTYYERYEMIRGAMREFKVPDSEYDILPFLSTARNTFYSTFQRTLPSIWASAMSGTKKNTRFLEASDWISKSFGGNLRRRKELLLPGFEAVLPQIRNGRIWFLKVSILI